MTCYHPIRCFRTTEKTKAGKYKIYFTKSHSCPSTEIQVNCSQCLGCRLEHARQWATRCLHEASLYEENAFITLTYDNKNLPWDHSLNKRHFQLFMKQFRKKYDHKKIRFYHAGEYGQATPENDFIARPHYHALIFNHQFSDRKTFSQREGITLFSSDTLDDIWGRGLTSTGSVTYESAAYVARYIMKKINGDDAYEHYTRTDHTTGQEIQIQPEYSTMSRRPGIGKGWYDNYKSDVYPSDSISVRGVPMSPPKYYDHLYELDNLDDFTTIKQTRKQNMRKHLKDNTPERLASRELVKKAQTTQLIRTL